jgi:hypothetical protein
MVHHDSSQTRVLLGDIVAVVLQKIINILDLGSIDGAGEGGRREL